MYERQAINLIHVIALAPELQVMADNLHKHLGEYLRKKRGDLTLLQFSKKLGISDASLHRIEQGDQNVTLKTLQQISSRLKCRIGEMIGE